MWTVVEERGAVKAIDGLPHNIAEKYTAWVNLVRQSGPQALRSVRGFRDEKLSGQLAHLRASRLGIHWRVIYRVESDVVTVTVENITPHVYR
jgi:mRNA-degrading endonuclease RelE of RelBE toxin-antitoxin system